MVGEDMREGMVGRGQQGGEGGEGGGWRILFHMNFRIISKLFMIIMSTVIRGIMIKIMIITNSKTK